MKVREIVHYPDGSQYVGNQQAKGSDGKAEDYHARSRGDLVNRPAYVELLRQHHSFDDERTGGSNLLAPNSAFSIRYELTAEQGTCRLDIIKRGAGFETEETRVEAGSGGAHSNVVAKRNAVPRITTPGTGVSYTENKTPVPIAATAGVSDADGIDLSRGTLIVKYTAGGLPEDRLTIRATDTLATDANQQLFYAGIVVGNFTGGVGRTPLVIRFHLNATTRIAQAVLRNIVYQTISENPSTNPRTTSLQVTDGAGGVSSAVSKTIQVFRVNDRPLLGNIGVRSAIGILAQPSRLPRRVKVLRPP